MAYYNTKVDKAKKSELKNLCDQSIHIFTDGSCWKKTRCGGWACVLIHRGHYKELYGGRSETTNNQMELQAILEALKAVKCRVRRVIVYSDSQYSINCVTTWGYGWAKNGWVTKQGKPVKNIELIQEIMAVAENLNVVFKWVKGHAGHKYNERADELAGQGRKEVENGTSK